jgi:hypothetical protein
MLFVYILKIVLISNKDRVCASSRNGHPPIELSLLEKKIVSRIRRAKLFIFLRQVRQRILIYQLLLLYFINLQSAVSQCPSI